MSTATVDPFAPAVSAQDELYQRITTLERDLARTDEDIKTCRDNEKRLLVHVAALENLHAQYTAIIEALQKPS